MHRCVFDDKDLFGPNKFQFLVDKHTIVCAHLQVGYALILPETIFLLESRKEARRKVSSNAPQGLFKVFSPCAQPNLPVDGQYFDGDGRHCRCHRCRCHGEGVVLGHTRDPRASGGAPFPLSFSACNTSLTSRMEHRITAEFLICAARTSMRDRALSAPFRYYFWFPFDAHAYIPLIGEGGVVQSPRRCLGAIARIPSARNSCIPRGSVISSLKLLSGVL